jgi:hypothetical protein
VTSEPFLILAVTDSPRSGDVAAGVGTATAWRYVEETVALLAARAPRLRKADRDAARAGHAYVVLTGR